MKYSRKFGTIPEPFQREVLDTALYSMLYDSGERYWSYALGRMNFVVDDNTTLLSANGSSDGFLVTGINFSSFMQLDIRQQKTALKHVCLHWLNGHVSSRITRLKDIYGDRIVGIATDMVISKLLDTTCLWEAGYIMPEPELFGFPEGLGTEAYCQLLAGHMEGKNPIPLQGPVANEENMEEFLEQMMNSEPATNPMQSPADVNTRSIDERLHQEIKNTPPDFIKHGKVDMQKLQKAIQDGRVIPVPFDDMNTQQAESLVDNNVANMIQQTQEKYKSHGWLTADAQEIIDSLKRDSVVPWNTLIRQKYRSHTDLLREATKARPSRRHTAYFGRRHASQCSMVIWIDTSGSMSGRELSLINAELDYLARRNVNIKVGHIDAAVCRAPELYRKGTELTTFFGRGGTDFRPAFDWMAENMRGDPPDFCVYFTDGLGSAYDWEDLPGWTKTLDLIWVLTDSGMKMDEFTANVASYGTTVPFDTRKGVPEKAYK